MTTTNSTPNNTLRIDCQIGAGGTITIDAAALPRDTVQKILELVLSGVSVDSQDRDELPPSLRSVATDTDHDPAPTPDPEPETPDTEPRTTDPQPAPTTPPVHTATPMRETVSTGFRQRSRHRIA